jgi:ketosteroid isomerase-like protein
MGSATEDTVIAEVLAADAERLEAIHSRDWDKLAEILSDDLTYTHMNGTFETKTENLVAFQVGSRFYEPRNVQIRPYGDMAIMNYDTQITIKRNPEDETGIVLQGRVMQVWRKQAGRWQVVGTQNTQLPKEGA